MLQNYINEICRERKINKLQLSYMTGISPGNIYNMAAGKVKAFKGWRQRIADALNVDEKVVFPYDDD